MCSWNCDYFFGISKTKIDYQNKEIRRSLKTLCSSCSLSGSKTNSFSISLVNFKHSACKHIQNLWLKYFSGLFCQHLKFSYFKINKTTFILFYILKYWNKKIYKIWKNNSISPNSFKKVFIAPNFHLTLFFHEATDSTVPFAEK